MTTRAEIIAQANKELRINKERILWKAKREIKGLDTRDMYDAQTVEKLFDKWLNLMADSTADALVLEKKEVRIGQHPEWNGGFNEAVFEQEAKRKEFIGEA